MWESASPNAVTFTALHSVRETLGLDRAGGTDSFGGFDGNSTGFRVGVIFGPENRGQLLTPDTADTLYRFRQFTVGEVLSQVWHRLIVLEGDGNG